MASNRRIWRGAMLFLLVALFLYAADFAYHALHFARVRGEVNYAESTWLFAALRIRHGLTPYFDYTQAPYIPMAYAPLLPGLAGWVGGLFGISDRQTMTLMRLFSPVSAFAIAGLIALICRWFRVNIVLALVSGLLFLTPQMTFSLWSLAARSDMFAVALSLGAITVCCFAARRGNLPAWSPLVAGALCGLALAAKQTAVAPAAAIVLWLLSGGTGAASWKARFGQIALVASGAVAAVALVLAPFGLEGGQRLLQGTLDLATHPQSAADLYTRLDDLVRMFGICFPLAVVGIWAMLSQTTDLKEASISQSFATGRLFLIYAATSATIFLITSAKLGSASSYALELIAVLSVAVGVGLSSLEKLFVSAERQVAMALLLLAVVPLSTQSWYAIKTAQSTQEAGPNDEPLAAMAQVRSGPVLSENGYILLDGAEPPYLLDPLFFSVQQRVGKWDASPVIKMVEEQKFVSVVLFHTLESRPTVNGVGWLPDGLYDALAANYEHVGSQGRFNVYMPRKP